jgi:hypothetical protein
MCVRTRGKVTLQQSAQSAVPVGGYEPNGRSARRKRGVAATH